MGTESFGRLVVGKAYTNTMRLFADKIKDTVFGVVLALPGGLFSLYRYGLPVEMESAWNFAAATFGPIGFVVVVVFLWNLWLAPAELAYDAWKLSLTNTLALTSPSPPFTNWSIWQKRAEYTVNEFAAILAKANPTGTDSADEVNAYARLIMEALRNGSLPYIRVRGVGGTEQPLSAQYTRIAKQMAIGWAVAKNFDVDHVK